MNTTIDTMAKRMTFTGWTCAIGEATTRAEIDEINHLLHEDYDSGYILDRDMEELLELSYHKAAPMPVNWQPSSWRELEDYANKEEFVLSQQLNY